MLGQTATALLVGIPLFAVGSTLVFTDDPKYMALGPVVMLLGAMFLLGPLL